jgi:hypothetical protein
MKSSGTHPAQLLTLTILTIACLPASGGTILQSNLFLPPSNAIDQPNSGRASAEKTETDHDAGRCPGVLVFSHKTGPIAGPCSGLRLLLPYPDLDPREVLNPYGDSDRREALPIPEGAIYMLPGAVFVVMGSLTKRRRSAGSS